MLIGLPWCLRVSLIISVPVATKLLLLNNSFILQIHEKLKHNVISYINILYYIMSEQDLKYPSRILNCPSRISNCPSRISNCPSRDSNP